MQFSFKLQTSKKENFKRKNTKLEKLIDKKHGGRPNSCVLPFINSPSLLEYELHQHAMLPLN